MMGISGFGSPAADYRKLGLSLDELLIENKAASFIARASGDALEGIGIFDGDVLVIDRSLNPKVGDVVCVVIEGEFVVRILGTDLSLQTTKPEIYSVIQFSKDTGNTVEGVVTRCVRCLRPTHLFAD